MIKNLTIKNFALIESIEIDFTGGLVIITGETGAGKSIIIDALGLVIGERANSDAVRVGSDKAIVEATFDVEGNRRLKSFLQENSIEPTDDLIARREVSAKGQSRCFLNDSPVTLAFLKQVGEFLVDLHGQHEHQSLLKVETHIRMLDDFGGLGGMVSQFQQQYRSLLSLQKEIADLRQQETQLREKADFLKFQMAEIDEIAPLPGEEEQLEQELKILENAEKLFGTTGRVYQILYEGDHSVHDQLVMARNDLFSLAAIDKKFQDAANDSSAAVILVNELAKFIQGYNANIDFSPERLEELRTRLGRLTMLRKKHGGTIDSIIEYRDRIGKEVSLAENYEEMINGLEREADDVRQECVTLAQRLSAKRTAVAKKIDKAVVQELERLGISNGKFVTSIRQTRLEVPIDGDASAGANNGTPAELTEHGMDRVEFYLSTNLGEEEKPLTKVASGGEVSRIMLALKSILAKSDRLPVLIFDEIDVGVSGRIAQSVGISLKNLSRFHQVIAITHLPQIAGLADSHFAVYKNEGSGRTITTLQKLNLDERVREVAKLMSGAEVTSAGIKGARELMGLK